MILYNVFYPGRSSDLNVPWSYLEKIAREKRFPTARAVPSNQDNQPGLVLRNGIWEEKCDHTRR